MRVDFIVDWASDAILRVVAMDRNSFKVILRRAALFDLVREFVLLGRHIAWQSKRRFGEVDRTLARDYFAASGLKKLHIGCGPRVLPGWLNADLKPTTAEIFRLDATTRFPFADNTFDYVFSEHMIEHVPYEGGRNMLSESFRILKPGGRIRISTPDLSKLIDLYRTESPFGAEYIAWYSSNLLSPRLPYCTPAFLLNRYVREWGHQFIYDCATLERAMFDAGFRDVVAADLQNSSDAVLCNLECEARLPPGYLKYETFTLEGIK